MLAAVAAVLLSRVLDQDDEESRKQLRKVEEKVQRMLDNVAVAQGRLLDYLLSVHENEAAEEKQPHVQLHRVYGRRPGENIREMDEHERQDRRRHRRVQDQVTPTLLQERAARQARENDSRPNTAHVKQSVRHSRQHITETK